jgi:hypothetical protein
MRDIEMAKDPSFIAVSEAIEILVNDGFDVQIEGLSDSPVIHAKKIGRDKTIYISKDNLVDGKAVLR